MKKKLDTFRGLKFRVKSKYNLHHRGTPLFNPKSQIDSFMKRIASESALSLKR